MSKAEREVATATVSQGRVICPKCGSSDSTLPHTTGNGIAYNCSRCWLVFTPPSLPEAVAGNASAPVGELPEKWRQSCSVGPILKEGTVKPVDVREGVLQCADELEKALRLLGRTCAEKARQLGFNVGDGDWWDTDEIVIGLLRAGRDRASLYMLECRNPDCAQQYDALSKKGADRDFCSVSCYTHYHSDGKDASLDPEQEGGYRAGIELWDAPTASMGEKRQPSEVQHGPSCEFIKDGKGTCGPDCGQPSGVGEPRTKPTNLQAEPPYPNHETVVMAMRAPNWTIHVLTDRCQKDWPHEMKDCAEWAIGREVGEGLREALQSILDHLVMVDENWNPEDSELRGRVKNMIAEADAALAAPAPKPAPPAKIECPRCGCGYEWSAIRPGCHCVCHD